MNTGTAHDTVLTVGHSTHSLEVFLGLLREHGVQVVADVRSAPYSRHCPQFNKKELSQSLKRHGIKYVFMGNELGARADDPSCYENGRVKYSRLAQRAAFKEGIARLTKGARDHRIALMCAEREPLECHRTLLVSRVLEQAGIVIEHILSDGRLERHEDAMERLLDISGLPHEDLFRTKEELMAEALARQEERVAYKDESLSAGNPGEAA